MTPQGRADAAERRGELLDGAVEYVLQHGVSGLSLRPLAAALHTSDRMLLYYFETRERLLRAVLEAIATQLRGFLVTALPPGPLPPRQMLAAALGAADDAGTGRLLAVWLEVVALAGAGDATCAATAAAVIDDWIGWLAGRLDLSSDGSPGGAGTGTGADEPARRQVAAAILAIIDGLVLLTAAGAREDATAAAGWLLARLPEGVPAPGR